jgi:D-inositol-3-phosphate glycosyltransferase
VIEDAGLRERLRAGALDQAREFAWERTAERTLEVYRQARAALLQEAAS